VRFSCGHSGFTCHDRCLVTFPFVVATSDEAIYTNQVASNLVAAHRGPSPAFATGFAAQPGVPASEEQPAAALPGWFSPRTAGQWVLFDLGQPRPVSALRLHLWLNSRESPRSVLLQSSAHQLGPWLDAGGGAAVSREDDDVV
jgi:hypothetical protein